MRKLNSYLIYQGNKRLSEKIILKISKKFQKLSKKNFKKLLLLRLICFIIVFKINSLTNNKQSFIVIKNKKTRISLAIKFMLKKIQNQKSNNFYKKLCVEIFSVLHHEVFNAVTKENLQEQVFLKKHLLFYYRWR